MPSKNHEIFLFVFHHVANKCMSAHTLGGHIFFEPSKIPPDHPRSYLPMKLNQNCTPENMRLRNIVEKSWVFQHVANIHLSAHALGGHIILFEPQRPLQTPQDPSKTPPKPLQDPSKSPLVPKETAKFRAR